jgi:hypothetical protein
MLASALSGNDNNIPDSIYQDKTAINLDNLSPTDKFKNKKQSSILSGAADEIFNNPFMDHILHHQRMR